MVTRSFTIPPNLEMVALHDRMPVILEQQDWPVWLGEADGDHAALLRAAPDGCSIIGSSVLTIRLDRFCMAMCRASRDLAARGKDRRPLS
jgi:hypothetical protein